MMSRFLQSTPNVCLSDFQTKRRKKNFFNCGQMLVGERLSLHQLLEYAAFILHRKKSSIKRKGFASMRMQCQNTLTCLIIFRYDIVHYFWSLQIVAMFSLIVIFQFNTGLVPKLLIKLNINNTILFCSVLNVISINGWHILALFTCRAWFIILNSVFITILTPCCYQAFR